MLYLRGLAFERTLLLDRSAKPSVFMSGRCSLTPILRSPGRGFLARTRISTSDQRRHCSRSARCSETCFGECAETGAELA